MHTHICYHLNHANTHADVCSEHALTCMHACMHAGMHVAQDEKMVKVMKAVVPEREEDLSQAFACMIAP